MINKDGVSRPLPARQLEAGPNTAMELRFLRKIPPTATRPTNIIPPLSGSGGATTDQR